MWAIVDPRFIRLWSRRLSTIMHEACFLCKSFRSTSQFDRESERRDRTHPFRGLDRDRRMVGCVKSINLQLSMNSTFLPSAAGKMHWRCVSAGDRYDRISAYVSQSDDPDSGPIHGKLR